MKAFTINDVRGHVVISGSTAEEALAILREKEELDKKTLGTNPVFSLSLTAADFRSIGETHCDPGVMTYCLRA